MQDPPDPSHEGSLNHPYVERRYVRVVKTKKTEDTSAVTGVLSEKRPRDAISSGNSNDKEEEEEEEEEEYSTDDDLETVTKRSRVGQLGIPTADTAGLQVSQQLRPARNISTPELPSPPMCNREPAVPMTHVTKPVINPHHLDFLGHREETRGASGFYLVNDAEAEQIWARQMEFTLEEDTDVQMGEAGEDAARTSATVKGVLSQDVLERRGAPVEVHSIQHSRVSAQQTASAQAENVLIPAAQRPSLECNFPNQPSHVSALPSEAEAVDNPRSLFSRQDKTHAPRDAEAVLSLVASEVVADSEIPRKARLAGVTENPENPSVESDLPKQPDSLASMQVVQASEHLASDPGDTMLAAFAMPALEETGPRSVVPPGLDTSVPSEIEHISALPAEGAADSFHADSMPGAAEPLFLRQDETYAPMDAEAVQSLVPSPEIAAASEIPQEAPVDVTENPWSDSAFSPRSMSVSGEAETPSGAIGSMTEISGLDPAADSAGDSRSAPLLSDCEASLLVSPQQRSPPMRSLTDLVGAASANAASIDLNPPLEPAGQSAAPYAEEPAVSPTSMQWESSTPGTADVTGDCRSDVPQATGPHRKPVDVQGSHAYHPYIAVKDRPTLTERLRQRNAPLISVNVPSAQGGERDQETSGRNPSPLLQRDQDYALSGSLPPPSPAYITPSADIGLPVTAAQTDSLQPSSTNAHAQPHGKPPPSPASIAPSADIGLPVTAAQTDNLQPSSTNAHAQPHGESRTDETPGPSTYPSVQPSVSKEKSENKSLATDHPPDHDQDDLVVMAQSQSQLNLEHSSASMDSLSALVEKRSDLAENRDPSYRSPTKDYAPSVSVSTSRPVDGDGPNALNVVTEPPGDFSSSVQMQQPDAPRQDVNRPSSWQTAMTYLKSSIPVFKSFQAEPAISTHIQHTDRTAGADFEPPSSQPVPPSAAPVASDLPSSSNTQDKYFASVDSDTEMNCEPERLSAKVKGKARASPPPGWKAIDYKKISSNQQQKFSHFPLGLDNESISQTRVARQPDERQKDRRRSRRSKAMISKRPKSPVKRAGRNFPRKSKFTQPSQRNNTADVGHPDAREDISPDQPTQPDPDVLMASYHSSDHGDNGNYLPNDSTSNGARADEEAVNLNGGDNSDDSCESWKGFSGYNLDFNGMDVDEEPTPIGLTLDINLQEEGGEHERESQSHHESDGESNNEYQGEDEGYEGEGNAYEGDGDGYEGEDDGYEGEDDEYKGGEGGYADGEDDDERDTGISLIREMKRDMAEMKKQNQKFYKQVDRKLDGIQKDRNVPSDGQGAPGLKTRRYHCRDVYKGIANGNDKNDQDFEMTGDVRRRPILVCKFQGDIRTHVHMLMKGPDEDNPRTGLADPAEAAGFNLKEADAPCCTIENFRISVHLGPRCDWNQSAARVFADWYIPRAIARFPNMKKKTAVEGFLTHAETLRSKFLKEMKKENELMQDAKRARMRERQKNLFHRRKDVAEFFPSLRHGVTMLRRLQINGMSEDDSDPGSDAEHNWGYPADVPVFRILKKRWRNPRVTTWLRILDTFYPEYLQAREKKQRKHPTQVRIRVETALYSSEDKDIVVPNLPVDAYSGTWLQRLNTFEKDKYMIREHESFHFEHNPETQSYVQALVQKRGHQASGSKAGNRSKARPSEREAGPSGSQPGPSRSNAGPASTKPHPKGGQTSAKDGNKPTTNMAGPSGIGRSSGPGRKPTTSKASTSSRRSRS